MSERVTKKDLQKLFKVTVDDLINTIQSGEAHHKDKEMALKLCNDFQIDIEDEFIPEGGGKVDALEKPLPFDEIQGLH